jgi:hypothetical protein
MRILTQSNYDIQDKFREIRIPLHGLYNKDDFPRDYRPGNYIINLDHSSGQGTHWTAMMVLPKEVIYFDSFGQDMPEILRRKLKGKKVFYNDKHLQDIHSSACAYWCIAFFCYMNRVKKWHKNTHLDHYQEFLDLFNPIDQSTNEQILEQFLKPF